jgi:hypothetical protein
MLPPPAGPPLATCFSGRSATIASVVIISEPTDAACCNADRTTLVGSMIPALTWSLKFAGLSIETPIVFSPVQDLARNHRTVLAGVLGDLAQRHLHRLAYDLDADALIVIFGIQLGQNQGRSRYLPQSRRRVR